MYVSARNEGPVCNMCFSKQILIFLVVGGGGWCFIFWKSYEDILKGA